VSTEVSQGLLISLILFTIYISRIFKVIETAISEVKALFFLDNIGIVVLASLVD
jgi:hypothetical protein